MVTFMSYIIVYKSSCLSGFSWNLSAVFCVSWVIFRDDIEFFPFVELKKYVYEVNGSETIVVVDSSSI
jgi:hypothetical protein